MAIGHVIYNPLAGKGTAQEDAKLLQVILDEDMEYYDITRITNYAAFIGGMEKDDFLVIVGGDGTLNRFINGVGFGIDGYCCQVGDALKKIPGKKVNYTGIAIKGLLFRFKSRNARVTVDGKEYAYRKVWIAPTMHGRYYGGGMMAAPSQDRGNADGTLSLVVLHGAGRFRTLCAFPGIFKGKHVKHTKMVAVHTGYEIKVEFDRPTPLQIDGETILNVTSYTARSDACIEKLGKC